MKVHLITDSANGRIYIRSVFNSKLNEVLKKLHGFRYDSYDYTFPLSTKVAVVSALIDLNIQVVEVKSLPPRIAIPKRGFYCFDYFNCSIVVAAPYHQQVNS